MSFEAMMNAFSVILVLLAVTQSGSCQAQNILKMVYYNECEGRYAYNFTLLSLSAGPDICHVENTSPIAQSQLIQAQPDSTSAVNSMKRLFSMSMPSGAYHQRETLYLLTGGPLEGNYIYDKTLIQNLDYMKKCSSVLGYSYVTSKSTLLFSDALDVNVLISPTGGYEVFKRGCNTICKGKGYLF